MPNSGSHNTGLWSYVQEYRRCKGPCATCRKGPGHGPYWYAKRRVDGKVKSRYIGKTLKGECEDEHKSVDL